MIILALHRGTRVAELARLNYERELSEHFTLMLSEFSKRLINNVSLLE